MTHQHKHVYMHSLSHTWTQILHFPTLRHKHTCKNRHTLTSRHIRLQRSYTHTLNHSLTHILHFHIHTETHSNFQRHALIHTPTQITHSHGDISWRGMLPHISTCIYNPKGTHMFTHTLMHTTMNTCGHILTISQTHTRHISTDCTLTWTHALTRLDLSLQAMLSLSPPSRPHQAQS